GVGGGLGAGYLGQPRAASGGTATPLPATSPSVPVDPPPTIAPYAPDIDYPPLAAGLTFGKQLMGNSSQSWIVPVPHGWQAYTVPGDEPVPRKERSGYDELRFRPADEPVEGGYSLRAKTVNAHQTPASMATSKISLLRDLTDVTYIRTTENTIRFTYRTAGNHLRYNYFHWFAAPGSSEVTLEMSVVGRERDVPGLDDLFAAFDSTLEPGS
ncbi:MAG: hypothetical protein ABIO16_16865, partial [Nocardioides sp.]